MDPGPASCVSSFWQGYSFSQALIQILLFFSGSWEDCFQLASKERMAGYHAYVRIMQQRVTGQDHCSGWIRLDFSSQLLNFQLLLKI